jgi:glycosyltransferase involved in cell wall biosynthesis
LTSLNIFQFSFGDGYAGSARIALQSSELLMKKGHKVTLFVSENSFTEKRAADAGINIISLDSSQSYSVLKNKIFSAYRDLKPQIIIGHHSLDRKLGLSLKKKFKNNLINISYRHNITKSVPLIGSFIYNMYSDYLIACSTGVKNSLTSSGIKESKVEVIYNGIDIPDNISDISGDELRQKINPENKIILGLSTWFHKERKGFDILFTAFSKLNDNFILLLAGIKGEDQEKVKNYAAEFGIDPERLILPGYVDNIWEYYKAMDVFLLPSRSEGFSLSLLEAAAAGVPIIASNIPGNNEFIKNGVNGMLFNPAKPEELTNNINLLLEDRRMGKVFSACALKNLMSRYTIQHYADYLEEFLLKVSEGKK